MNKKIKLLALDLGLHQNQINSSLGTHPNGPQFLDISNPQTNDRGENITAIHLQWQR